MITDRDLQVAVNKCVEPLEGEVEKATALARKRIGPQLLLAERLLEQRTAQAQRLEEMIKAGGV